MKGLLWKDLLLTWKYCRIMLVFIVLYTLTALFVEELSLIWSVFPYLILGALPTSIFSYDEREGFCAYCAGALPVSRAQYVTGKYVMTLFFVPVAVVVSVIGQITQMAAGRFTWGGLGTAAALGVSAMLLVTTLILPIMFKLGAERGRIYYMVIYGGIFGVVAALALAFMEDLSDLDQLSGGLAGWWVVLVLAAAVVLFVLSWRLSVRFYSKREL